MAPGAGGAQGEQGSVLRLWKFQALAGSRLSTWGMQHNILYLLWFTGSPGEQASAKSGLQSFLRKRKYRLIPCLVVVGRIELMMALKGIYGDEQSIRKEMEKGTFHSTDQVFT